MKRAYALAGLLVALVGCDELESNAKGHCNHFAPEPLRLADSLAYLAPYGRVAFYDLAERQLSGVGVGRIRAATTVPSTRSGEAGIALLTDLEPADSNSCAELGPGLGRAKLVVFGGERQPHECQLALGQYARLLVDGALVVGLPALDETPVGAAGTEPGHILLADTSASLATSAAAPTCLEVEHSDAKRLTAVAVGKNSETRWVAMASPTEVVLVATQAGALVRVGPGYRVTLPMRSGAVTSPSLFFDRNSSRLFIWASGSAEVMWLDLSASDGKEETKPLLTRASFDFEPRQVTSASTAGGTEVLLGIAPLGRGEGARVGVVIPSTQASASFPTEIPADSFLMLRDDPLKSDSALLYLEQPKLLGADLVGLGKADTLLARAFSPPALDTDATAEPPVRSLELGAPYRALRKLDGNSVLFEDDEGALLFNLADSTLTRVAELNASMRFIDAGSELDGLFFTKQPAAAGQQLIHAFRKLGGQRMGRFEVVADVSHLIEMSSSAYVLVHPGALGSFTYYSASSDQSFATTGFLIEEQFQ